MPKHALLLTAAICLAAGAAFAQHDPGHDHAAAAATAAKAPAFSLQDQDGKIHDLGKYAGKVVVLEWTNPECPFVQYHGEHGTMKTLAQKYASQGVVWLAVNSTKHATREKNREWIAQHKLPYPVLEDFDGTVGKAYGAKTTPHMFVITADGTIAYEGAIDDDNRISGKASVNHVEQALEALMTGKVVATAKTAPYGCSVKYRS